MGTSSARGKWSLGFLLRRIPTALRWPWSILRWGSVLTAALLVIAAISLTGPSSRLGQSLILSSYDWSFRLSALSPGPLRDSEVVLVYMDDKSHRDLNEPYDRPWNRRRHAALLDRLATLGAKAVIFDIVFSGPGPDAEIDEAFAKSIHENGRVILAADYTPHLQGGHVIENTVTRPFELFEDAAAGYGLAGLMASQDLDFIVRKHWHGTKDEPDLSWAAAALAQLPVAQKPNQRLNERWIRYYGGPGSIPGVSYVSVLQTNGVAPGFFRDKFVFVGARPMSKYSGERRDELRTPFMSAESTVFPFIPSVDVHAMQLLNLVREDWLRRLPAGVETGLLVLSGLVLGFGLSRFRLMAGTGIALGIALGATSVAFVAFSYFDVWFPWLIVTAVQVPGAWMGCVAFRSADWYVQRRRLEEERSRNYLRIREQAELLDKAQDAIIVNDLSWKVRFWNHSAERLYGWSATEVLGKPLTAQLLRLDDPTFHDAVKKVLETGEWSGELRHKTKTGAELTVQCRWSLVRDDQGRPKSILTINSDVSEQKKLEAQFLRAQRMESLGTLAGGIAHDLNNVLSPIVMGTELLLEVLKEPAAHKTLKTMASSAKRGADMVKQVLSFARGTEGEKIVLQLNHLIKEMQKIVKETFPKNIEIRSSLDKDLAPISGDATQMHQVLLNLCVNARDAMPNGGSISIEAKNVVLTEAEAQRILGARPISYVLLRVTDSGTGIPPEIIDKIFEPFFTTKEQGKGTGLGLSTVISIVKGHGGVLQVDSTVGKGTTFNIYLPAADPSSRNALEQKARELKVGKNQLILLVDDETAVLDVAACALTGSGYRVLTADSGAQAVELCKSQTSGIDLAVIDMMMPKMDGPATVRALKGVQPNLRFVVSTGLNEGEKTRARFGDEAVAILPKPFSIDQLRQTVQDHLAPA